MYLLAPELGTPLGVAIGALLLDPHGGGQDQIRRLRGNGRVGVGDSDEVVRVAPAGQRLTVHIGGGLHIVVALLPVAVHHAVLELAVHQYGMESNLGVDGAFRQFPHLFGKGPMLRFHHYQVGRQTMGEGAHLAGGAAGRRLAGQREGTVTGLGDLAHQQMDVVDQTVHPNTACMLIHAHGPVGADLLVRVGINLGQALQVRFRYTGHLVGLVERVFRDQLGVVFEADLVELAFTGVLRCLLQRVFGTQTVADVGGGGVEVDVLVDELLVISLVLDDVVGDVVSDYQIGLRGEDDRVVCQLEAAVGVGGEHMHFTAGFGQPRVGKTRPENRVHLRHVGAPENECVGVFQVVIAAHWFIDAKGAHESAHGGGHAVAGVGVQVVGAQTRLHELGSGIALPNGPLAGAEDTDSARSLGLERGLPLFGHDIEGFIPGDGFELAVLVVLAVGLAQQGFAEAVLAVEDLGQEITLDAIEALVHRRVGIALTGDHFAVLDPHQHTAAGAAVTAGCLVPTDTVIGIGGRNPTHGQGDAGNRCSSRDGVVFDEFASS